MIQLLLEDVMRYSNSEFSRLNLPKRCIKRTQLARFFVQLHMPISLFCVYYRKVFLFLAMELRQDFINCSCVVMLSSNVFVEIARIQAKANFLFTVWQVLHVAND